MLTESKRRKIFPPLPEHRDVAPIRLSRLPERSQKLNSNPTAEELMQHCSALLASIQTVREFQNIPEKKPSSIDRVLATLNRQQSLDEKNKLLHQYHLEIIQMQQVVIREKQFRISCVTNLNDINTKLELAYTQKQAEHMLEDHIKNIRQLRAKLLEKLCEYEYRIPQSRIVSKPESLQTCINDLNTYLDRHNNEINTLMLNLLISRENTYNKFEDDLNKAIAFYIRLSSITDNMLAMKCQKEHMKDYIVEMANHFKAVDAILEYSKAETARMKCNQQNEKFKNLAEVYESNCKLFIKMTSESYAPEYSKCVAEYRQAFIQYFKRYEQYLKNCVLFENLLKNFIEANDVGRRALAHPNDTDKGKLIRLYNNTLSSQPPIQVSNIKQRVLNLIEKDMKLLNQPLPGRVKTDISGQFLKLQMGKFIKYFQRLEGGKISYLMKSKDIVLEYLYQLKNMKVETHQECIIDDYTQYFNLTLIIYQFLTIIYEDKFRIIKKNWQELIISNSDKQLEQKLLGHIYGINEIYKKIWRGLPIGLQKCLYISIRDIFIVTSFGLKKFTPQIVLGLNQEEFKFKSKLDKSRLLTAIDVRNILPDQLFGKHIFEVLRQIHTISDENKVLRRFLLDNFLSLYKTFVNFTLNKLDLSKQKQQQLEESFIYQGQNRFFQIFSLYMLNKIGKVKVLENFFDLVEKNVKLICQNWKTFQVPEKLRTLVKISMLIDVLQHYKSNIFRYRFYKENLLYFHRILRSYLELQVVSANFEDLTQSNKIRGIVYLLTVLKQLQELTAKQIPPEETLSKILSQFKKSLQQQGLVKIPPEANIDRILMSMNALKSEIDLFQISSHPDFRQLYGIQKRSILYFYLNSMKSFIDSKQLMKPSDRLIIFIGDKFEVIDFSKTAYQTQAQKIMVAYQHWVFYVFSTLRNRRYDIAENKPKDSNLVKVVDWAFK